MSFESIGPLHHRCVSCAGSCHGDIVTLVGGEREALEALGPDLGVDDPIDGAVLRRVDGHCVFLDDDGRCRIHKVHGFEAKPLACQQFPLLAVRVDADTIRLTVDPGCLYAWKAWEVGPEAEVGRLMVGDGSQSETWDLQEAALLELLDPDERGVVDVLSAMGDDVMEELVRTMVSTRLGTRFVHPDTAPFIREKLLHVSARLHMLDPDHLPAWSVPKAQDRWAVEAARRAVYARAPRGVPPTVRALAVLAGALACGWADPDMERFGPSLAVWCRIMRTDALRWLFPDV